MHISDKQLEIIEDLPLDGVDRWYVLLALVKLKKASWLTVSSTVWREGDAPLHVPNERLDLITSKLTSLGISYRLHRRNTDAGLWQPNEESNLRTRYNEIVDIYIGVDEVAAETLETAVESGDDKAIGTALDYPATAVAVFDTDNIFTDQDSLKESFPQHVIDNTYFVLSKDHYADELRVVESWLNAIEATGSSILKIELGKTYL